MIWPPRPTCHAKAPHANLAKLDVWRKPDDAGDDRQQPAPRPFRTCDYCGSICAEDLVKLAAEHPISFDVADWKYGWPHKFYVHGIPNPLAGQQVRVGGRYYTNASGKRCEDAIMGVAPAEVHAKFYNEHLLDEGYDAESFAAIVEVLKRSGIAFGRDAKGVHYTRA